MAKSPRPRNEDQRLAELQSLGIFDSDPEPRYDRIAQLACHVAKSTIAYISFVDDKHSCLKTKSDVLERSARRDESFCSHVIAAQEPLIVTNAIEDERFRTCPWVTNSPHLRFVAGWPIKGPSGCSVGVLCVADTCERSMSKTDADAMALLAQQVEHELTRGVDAGVQKQLGKAQRKLASLHRHLENELGKMRAFIASRLPQPLKGKVQSDAIYVSSDQLGGDAFGYQWLDDENLIMYLLDVSGHGVAASLLATSIDDVLRRQDIADVSFVSPSEVLEALNELFLMDSVHGTFFTIWYGVFHAPSRTIVFSSGGHHAAVLIDQFTGHTEHLFNENMMLGVQVGIEYEESSFKIQPGERLYLYGDGVFEVQTAQRRMLGTDGLEEIIRGCQPLTENRPRAIFESVSKASEDQQLHDDFCLVEFEF